MFKRIYILFISIAFFSSCSSSDVGEEEVTDTFDRGAMLTNIADNIIIPAYADFSSKMSSLKTAGETFTTTPNQTNLESLRTSWLAAYTTWQQVEMFNIGKADELEFSYHMNVYPLNSSDVEENITNGGYDLDNVNNRDAQGFSALDYLLYGVADSDTAILAKYTTNSNADGYKQYITDLLTQMNTLTEQVVTSFTTNRNSFIASSGNTVTSSLNLFVNEYVFFVEKKIRTNKLGIPVGVFSSTALPEKVEGFYSKIYSKQLALEALKAAENVFTGKHYNSSTNGIGFSNYLNELEREDISASIINQNTVVKTQINGLNANFYEQINTNDIIVLKTYDELQKVVVLLKVDMLQAFNISVDYVDADGD